MDFISDHEKNATRFLDGLPEISKELSKQAGVPIQINGFSRGSLLENDNILKDFDGNSPYAQQFKASLDELDIETANASSVRVDFSARIEGILKLALERVDDWAGECKGRIDYRYGYDRSEPFNLGEHSSEKEDQGRYMLTRDYLIYAK